MDSHTLIQLNEAYRNEVYPQEEILSQEEFLGLQEWVEALIEEGYDLDEYSDDELYEAYLFDLKEAKVDSNLTPLQKIRKRNQDPSLVMPVGQQTAERRAYHKGGRGVKKEKGEKSAFGTMRHIGGPYKEELDLYDLVSEYLVSEGFCDSYEDADVIMANMSEEWREGIVEEVLDERNRGEIGMSNREVSRRRNLGLRNPEISSGAFGDHGPQKAIQKWHRIKGKTRRLEHETSRELRGDLGRLSGTGPKSRYQGNKGNDDGYPSIIHRGEGPF